MTLKLFILIQICYKLSQMVLESMVPRLQDMRPVCLLKAITPAWVTYTVSFTSAIDYTRYCGSFEVLQANVKCLLSVGPTCPVPRNSNKNYSTRGGPIIVSFMYIT